MDNLHLVQLNIVCIQGAAAVCRLIPTYSAGNTKSVY